MKIEYSDELYPERLRELSNPPSRLYILGNLEILNNYGIAVIGSRHNTQYGEKMCKQFTKNLVEYGFNIISGLAIGIDTIAHETCLKNSGKTIAVLPCGLKNIYPKSNAILANKILENDGILLTEYEDNITADSNKFRERNRIVAGLGIGTLVVEAGERSGTNITARNTIEQGKTVFSIPSNLDNKKGKTTNNLIKNGCNLVTDINDILKQYRDIKFTKRTISKRDVCLDIPSELLEIYKVLNNDPKSIKDISNETGMTISEINYKLMMLEIENKIKELPGQTFVRNYDE
jgi:DNA processing protein